jgi:spore coat polysaccharide biosynthesis protein SpsF (cytidylyltransferase family)
MIVAIIQARMSSTRLPGKVLMPIGDRPLLECVVRRTRRAGSLSKVVVATSDRPADDAIESFCRLQGVPCFRGDELDVLDRYYQAARSHGAEAVVRVTADCPFIDPAVIDRVVATYLRGGYDYVANINPPTYPDGLDTEVFSTDALTRAWKEGRLPTYREHVTTYIRFHPNAFRIHNVRHDPDLSSLRWTVDEPRDLQFIREVYGRLGDDEFGMDDVLRVLREEPALGQINVGIERDAGLKASMRKDCLA